MLDEDRELSLREKCLNALRNKSVPVLFLTAIDYTFVFVAANTLGRLAYNGRYLKGKWFARPWSQGWRWVWNGFLGKAFLGIGRGIPWPISPLCSTGKNVDFSVDDINNFQTDIRYQTFGSARIRLGEGVWIAKGCALITTNHDPANPDVHLMPQDINIGSHCWLGTNVVVMPGVTLGPYTTVGANAVVTKSFPEGHCVIAGVPAKLIRTTYFGDNQ